MEKDFLVFISTAKPIGILKERIKNWKLKILLLYKFFLKSLINSRKKHFRANCDYFICCEQQILLELEKCFLKIKNLKLHY